MNYSGIRMFVDESGRPRAVWPEGGDAGKLVTSFLETDLQDSAYCGRIIDESSRLARTRAGRRWKCTGNAFSVSVGSVSTILRLLHASGAGPARLTISTREFVSLVRRWARQFSESDHPDGEASALPADGGYGKQPRPVLPGGTHMVRLPA